MIEELRFLIDTVKEASKIITEDFEVNAKGTKGDLVTNLDYEIEKFILNEIKNKYPNFDVVSEEFNSKKELTENCFTVDPLDGTVNFANNIPLWGIQVACIKNSKTCAAVIYLPKLNELYYADESGAYLNDKKLVLNKSEYKNFMYAVEGVNRMPSLVRMSKHGGHPRIVGSACVDFAWVASGRLDGIIFRYNTYWDYIPGTYIAKQAGAVVIDKYRAHIASNSKELAEILIKEAKFFEGDEVISVKTPQD